MPTYHVEPEYEDGEEKIIARTSDGRTLSPRNDLTSHDHPVYNWGRYDAGAVVLSATLLADAFGDAIAENYADHVARSWAQEITAAQFRIEASELRHFLPEGVP